MLDRKQFWKITHPFLEQQLAKWGFAPETRGQFMRKHEDYWDGIEVGMLRGGRDFRVLVGIHLPSQYERSKFINKWNHRTFEISHYLGDIREGRLVGVVQSFPFVNEWELRERLEQRVVPRLEAWELPWFPKFRSLADVAEEFYNLRLKPDPLKASADQRLNPSDEFGWAMYGWMLVTLNRRDEAQKWLRRAYDEIRKPLYIDKIGRFVSESTKGAKLFRHPEAEERLEELLRQSLNSNTNPLAS